MSSPDSPFLAEQLRGTFIARQVGRANRRLFILNALLVLGVAGYMIANARYFTNFARGPVPMSPSQLASVTNPNSLTKYFVSVSGDKIFDSGIQHVEQQVNETTNKVESQTVDADYLILVVDERFLIVKVPHGATGTQFRGALVDLPADVRSEIVGQVTNPKVVRLFLPVMLDASNFREEGYWTIAICLPILGFAGWNLRKFYARVQNPSTHPIIVALGRFGSVPQLAMEIEGELRGETEALGSARVTQSWIFVSQNFGLSMCRIPEIVWAYKKVTRHSWNFIPTGKSYGAIIFGRDGRPIETGGAQKKMDRLLEIVGSRTPWALVGFSDEINNLVRSNWLGFVAEIDARRSKAAGASATS